MVLVFQGACLVPPWRGRRRRRGCDSAPCGVARGKGGAPDRSAARQGGRRRSSPRRRATTGRRSEEHTSELQSLMRISYAVFCLKKKTSHATYTQSNRRHNDEASRRAT